MERAEADMKVIDTLVEELKAGLDIRIQQLKERSIARLEEEPESSAALANEVQHIRMAVARIFALVESFAEINTIMEPSRRLRKFIADGVKNTEREPSDVSDQEVQSALITLKEFGYTQKQIAEKTGIRQGHLSRVKNGTKHLSPRTKSRLFAFIASLHLQATGGDPAK